ncbi:TPA: tail fiber domain-containing protein [Escherichia coli]
MTVSTEVDHNEYTGNGVTTSFPYTFRIFKKSDLVVQVSDLNGNVTELVLDTGYTVTGAGTYSGGSVVLPSPLAAGWRITIDRVLDVVQETDLRNQGNFFPEVHEDAFDYLTMLIQQCFGWFRRALMKPSLLAKYYDAKQNRISNLADPSLEQDAVNNRSMRNYVDAAIAGVVGGFGWFIQYGSGAVYRTFQDKMRDEINVHDYGAIGDGNYHPLSERYSSLAAAQQQYPFATSLGQSIDWAAIQAAINASQGRKVKLLAKTYISTDGFTGVDGLCLIGEGATPFYLNFQDIPYTNNGGTDILFYGTGQKNRSIYGISDMQPSGGVRTDPDLGVTHALTNMTNGDASTSAAATPRSVSAGLYLEHCKGWQIEGIRFAPYFNGVESYTDQTNLGLADEWDIGILINSSYDGVMRDVRAVGHWRVAGLAEFAGENPFNTGASSSCERNRFFSCQFNGKSGVLIRGGDAYRCTAVTADTVEIPWHDSNPFRHTGGVFLGAFGGATSASYTYTSATVTGDKLTLHGVSPNPLSNGMTTSSGVYTGRSYGFQGTQFFGCYFGGLEHQTNRVATDPALTSPFPTSSKPVEISGVPAGNIRFYGCTHMTREDCVWMIHNASNIYDFGGYFEAKRAITATGGGSRMVAIGNWPDYTPTAESPYPFGTVSNINMFGSQALNFVDMYPVVARSTGVTRFTSGMWDCKTLYSTEAFQDLADTNNYVIKGLRNESIRFEDGAGGHLMTMQNIGNLLLGKRARFNTSTEDRYQFYRLDGTTIFLSLDGTMSTPVMTLDGNFVPAVANTRLVGTAAKPFSGGNTQTAYNITSDRNYKTDFGEIPDAVLDAWELVQYSQYKLRDAVALKGEGARLHVGVVAQQVKEAFESVGVDPFAYGVLCYDEWSGQEEVIEDGVITQQKVEAGKRYSVRYEEAYAIESALLRRTHTRLEQRLSSLEEKSK